MCKIDGEQRAQPGPGRQQTEISVYGGKAGAERERDGARGSEEGKANNRVMTVECRRSSPRKKGHPLDAERKR